MALQCGIVGLPNVGKSTLFNALTNGKALAANYPFATKDPNLGVITVPDPRLDKLAELVHPQRTVPTTVEILDIAGLIKGASQGEGLGNQFLANIREVDAIVHVVRCFDDDNVVHVDGSVNPVRDKEIIDLELGLKDLETVDKRLDKLVRAVRVGNKEDQRAAEVLAEVKKHLDAFEKISIGNKEGGPIAALDIASRFRWLTAKRSTVLQTSGVHPGLCKDANATLRKLHSQLVVC